MRYQTYHNLRRIRSWVITLPLWFIVRWPLLGVVVLVGCGLVPLAGLGLAAWFALLFIWTLRNPSGSTGNCAGAFGDAAVLLGGVVGAVLSLVAAGIGAIF